MLEFETVTPERPAAGAPVLVLLHGRGADRHDLLGLRPYLPPSWTVITPDAPYAAAPWGYGPGRAWYRYLGDNRPEPDSFSGSLERLAAFLRSLPDAVSAEAGPIVLGGFSQGGTIALGYALARAAGHLGDDAPAIPLVVNLSGFLADHPWVDASRATVAGARSSGHAASGRLRFAAESQPRRAGTRFFWGHGTRDGNIPFAMAESGRAVLRAAGADLFERDYEIGHWIDGDEVRDIVEWVSA